MRRLSFAPCARSVVAEGRASSALIRGYSVATLHSSVEVNEELPVFKDAYQKALKKYGAKEGSETAHHLKTLIKSKVVGLEGIKVQNPGDYDNFVKAVEELEDLSANYAQEIRPNVDEAFDSKNHPFVTDPIGAEIFQNASDLIDKQNHLTGVFKQRLGLTPRRMAEYLWTQVEQGVLDQEYDPPQDHSRGDLPDWLARALENTSFKKVKSKKEFLDATFAPLQFEFDTAATKKALAGDKKEAVALAVAQVAAAEGFAPGSPEYAEVQNRLAKLDPVPVAGSEDLKKSTNELNQKLADIRGKFEELLTPEPKIFYEEVVNTLRYTGENGVARRAVSGFLLTKSEPSDDDKLKFMKTLRDAIRQRRKYHGFVPRELYPALSLPAERNVDDKTLVAKFNELAASL